jgi:hypothetical protein
MFELQQHALERDALLPQVMEDCVKGSCRGLCTTLQSMTAVHQHFGLYDGHQPGFLAKRRVESQDQRVGLKTSTAWSSVVDSDDSAPLCEARAQLHILPEPFAEAVEALRELFVRVRGHRFGSGIDLDTRDDTDLLERFGKGHPAPCLLTDRLVDEDRAVEAISQTCGGNDHVAVGAAGLFGLRDSCCGEPFVGSRRALIHGEKPLVACHQSIGGFAQLLHIHSKVTFRL